jgi:hypothetical protein
VLSLVFVPAVFAVMDDIGSAIWRLFSRFVGETDEEATAKPEAGGSRQWPMAAE